MLGHVLDIKNYEFSVYSLPLFFASIMATVMGAYVLFRMHASRHGFTFFLFTSSLSLWYGSFGVACSTTDAELSLLWFRLSNIGVILIPITNYSFVSAITQRERHNRRFIWGAYLISFLFILSTLFSNLLIKGVNRFFWGYYMQYGPLGPLLILFFGLIVFKIVSTLWTEYQAATIDRARKRLKGLIIGIPLGYIASIDFVPTFGIPLYPFGYFPVVLFLGVMTYIIIRFQLVDITPQTAATQILKTMQGPLIVVDLEQRIRVINNAACVIFGYQESEMLDKNLLTILVLPKQLRDYRMLENHPVNDFQVSFVDKRGNQVYLSLSASVLTASDNEPYGIVYVALDITSHKELEAALAKAKDNADTLVTERTAELSQTVENLRNEIEERMRMELALKKAAAEWRITFDSTKDIIIMLNSRFEVLKANRAAVEVLKLPFPDIVGNPLIGLDGHCNFLNRTDLFGALKKAKHRTERELYVEEKGLALVLTADPIFNHEGEFAGAVLIARDVTAVKKAEEEQRISEQRYRALFDNANDGIAVVKRGGIIVNANQRFGELHGFERSALIGTNIRLLETETYGDEEKNWIDRVLQGETFVFETEHHRKDGSRILLEISSKAIDIGGQLHIQSFHRDITEKKRLQEQLFQSQKMESIGVLAGGIAHDFNNILSAILGHAELLHETSDLDEVGKRRAKIIENSARRAGAMITKLLSFAREERFEVLPLNLNTIVKDTIELLERSMVKRNVAIKVLYEESCPLISGDANHLEQVIMNIIVNAADAMPEGGTVTVTTSFEDLQTGAAHIHPLLTPGRYDVLSISDTGTGIPDEIKNKIFDPFFTTKKHGKGTGLGLAMVYGIVKEHKGVISLKTQMGEGTTFDIYLPVSSGVLPMVERPHYPPLKKGREKILVVEDESDVLSFMKEVLESQGYQVVATDNPVSAQEIYQKIADGLSLVVTDIVMPLLSGWELTKHFKLINPSVKIIAVSGYDFLQTKPRDKDVDAYVRKPFSSIYFLSVVRRVLDSAGSAAHLK